MKNVKNTFLKETAIEKALEAMREIVSSLEKDGRDVDVVIFENDDEAPRAGCRGIIRKVDGYYISARFGANYNHSRYSRRYPADSENFFPALEMSVRDRRNTYTNLKTTNIVKKIKEVLETEKFREERKRRSRETAELREGRFDSAKGAVEVLEEKSYIREFTIAAGIVTPLDSDRVKLTAYLTVEELQAVNELIAQRRAQ